MGTSTISMAIFNSYFDITRPGRSATKPCIVPPWKIAADPMFSHRKAAPGWVSSAPAPTSTSSAWRNGAAISAGRAGWIGHGNIQVFPMTEFHMEE